MEQNVTTDMQLTVIERSAEVFKTAGQILRANKERADKALTIGKDILTAIQASGMTPDLDARAMNYLANISKALPDMKEKRAEVTQIMDALKKMYTEVENNLDPKKENTIPALIQHNRNEYAKQKAAEERKRQEEADLRAAKATEEVEIRSAVKLWISNQLISLLTSKITAITNTFNAINLDTYEAKKQGLNALIATVSGSELSEKIGVHNLHPLSIISGSRHDVHEIEAIRNAVYDSFNFSEWGLVNWTPKMEQIKSDLLDKLPSKQAELLEQKRIADEAEELRNIELRRQAAENKRRSEEIAQANAAQKKRLEKEAEEQKLRDAERMKQMEEEATQKRLAAEAEQKKREQEECERLNREAEDAKAKEALNIEMNKQAEQTMVMFDKEAAIAEGDQGPAARLGYEIDVTHQAGYVQIFQFWFERTGKNLPLDKMEKTSLGQMKAFCEKTAHGTGEKIESKFLKYEPSFKAVNRKKVA